MADGTIGVQQSGAPDRLVDNEAINNGMGQTVYRERVQIGDANLHNLARVESSDPAGTDFGLVVRNIPGASVQKVDGSAVTQPVSGSVSVSNFPATQPVSGTVTANQGAANTVANAWPTKMVDSGGVNVATVSAAGAVKVDGSAVTQPVSGTVTVNQGTSPWVTSLASTTVTNTVAVNGADTPADAHANPTTDVAVTAFGEVFNGTTWDRLRSGTATGSVLVNNPTAANLNATVTGTVAVSGTSTVAGSDTPTDAHANPTTAVPVAGYGSVFNGTTWDRMREGTATGSVLVNNATAANLAATVTQGPAAAVAGAWPFKMVDSAGVNVATVTAAGAVKVDGSAVTQPVSGTVTANQGTSPWVTSLASTTVTNTVTVAGAQTPGDAVANPTDALDTRSFPGVFNGTTWDRMREGTATGSLLVNNPTAANLQVTATQSGTYQVAGTVTALQGSPPWSVDFTAVTLLLDQMLLEQRRTNRLLEQILGETPQFTETDLQSDR